MTPIEAARQVLAELRAAEANAIRTNKPTMWVYYREQVDTFAPLEHDVADTRIVDFLRFCVGEAERISSGRTYEFAQGHVQEVAYAYARGVYARRILRLCGETIKAPSLAWLRAQQREGAA